MTTTTQITNIANKLDLTDYVGEFIDDYDMDAVHEAWADYLDAQLPDGITLCRNGDVIAELDLADQARDMDWDAFVNEQSYAELIRILTRHDRTAAQDDPEGEVHP
jgi:hypothetical protein